MTIVLLAHSAVETVNDPRAPAYTSYQLRLHKRARGLVQDEVDVIGFLATDVAVVSQDAGFNKKRNRAEGGAARWLHFEGRPAFFRRSCFVQRISTSALLWRRFSRRSHRDRPKCDRPNQWRKK
jgi:hypothetical protein